MDTNERLKLFSNVQRRLPASIKRTFNFKRKDISYCVDLGNSQSIYILYKINYEGIEYLLYVWNSLFDKNAFCCDCYKGIRRKPVFFEIV